MLGQLELNQYKNNLIGGTRTAGRMKKNINLTLTFFRQSFWDSLRKMMIKPFFFKGGPKVQLDIISRPENKRCSKSGRTKTKMMGRNQALQR